MNDRRRAAAMSCHSTPIILILVLVGVAGIVEVFGISTLERPVLHGLINVVLVVGLYIFIGNSGILSFGHLGFMAIGAYITAWMMMPVAMKGMGAPNLPELLGGIQYGMWTTVGIAAALAGIVAALSGGIIMRLSGLAAAIATLALMAIVYVFASNWTGVTGGSTGLIGVPRNLTIGIGLLFAGFAILVAHIHANSRYGMALRATREDELAAEASGISPYWAKLVAFAISGAVVGCAGSLHAQFLGLVNADSYYLGPTFIALTMLIVGGMGSLSGAVVGVLTVSVLVELLGRMERGIEIGGAALKMPVGSQAFVVAILMCVVLVFRKSGIMNGREFYVDGRWFIGR